jgi:squalene-associated FAD-dependent desaturase
MKETSPVIIVGGGWAGISAAIELSRHQTPILLLESAKQLGGRARSVNANGLHADNGQHLLLGAYETTLGLLRTIGVSEAGVFQRRKLTLQWLQPKGKRLSLKSPPLPAPLHLAWAILFASGLSLAEKMNALRFSKTMLKNRFQIEEDCSVLTLLQRYGQSDHIILAIWEPLCLSALNTPIHEASAEIFLRTLGDAFRYSRRDSDLLLTCRELGEILPEPAMDYIEDKGGQIRLGTRVTQLLIKDQVIRGVRCENEEIYSSHTILAVPHQIAARLMHGHAELSGITSRLQQIKDQPICTVYLQYPDHVQLPFPMQGSLHTLTQWIFDRRIYGQHGLMAVVISADGDHMHWDNATLCGHITQELAILFPHWPAPVSRQVIREKRATFASSVNVNQYRPAHATPVKGLWLAGDYTDVGLPATLEGAVRSGVQSAQQVLQSLRNPQQEQITHV